MTSERPRSETRILAEPAPHEERADLLHLALRGLPARQRDALRLAAIDRLDVAGIAGHLGSDPVAVRSDLRDALHSLRAVLDVIEPVHDAPAPHVPDA